MKHLSFPTALGLLLLVAQAAFSQNWDSAGTYRLPYANGTDVRVWQDHASHSPVTNRLDLKGINGSDPYRIVAAGCGYIRYIVDNNTINCTTNGCSQYNNYVWIEHDNGEWTKYSHFRTGTVTGKAGLSVGMYVCDGTYLGDEGDVGAASSQHLHFEVAVPNDPSDPINPVGGFIKGVNLIPRFCKIGKVAKNNTYTAGDCDTVEMAQGVYRIPYATGTQVFASRDHITHSPVQNRLDLVGTGGRDGTYSVVAAADGVIRAIVDTNTVSCTTNGCSDFNNYVWIEHPNGEWTKYTHFRTGSVQGKANLSVGQQVCAGTYLGDEGAIGAAAGQHLHFEVAVPTNPVTPFDEKGGFINGFNRIPVFCDIAGNVMVAGQTYTAAPCDSGRSACVSDILLPSIGIAGARVYMASDEIDSNHSDYFISRCGTVNMTAGNRIVFRPGFRSYYHSYLRAAIRDCNEMERLGACLPIVIGGK